MHTGSHSQAPAPGAALQPCEVQQRKRQVWDRKLPDSFTYREEDRPGGAAREAPKKRKAAASTTTRTWSSRAAGWHPGKGEASAAAADRALEAAEERAEELGNWACAKRMTQSMVSGGFWCSAPSCMAPALGRTDRSLDKQLVHFLVEGSDGTDDREDLYPGDVVVYEVMPPPAPGQPSSTIKAHIFRALDFEAPAERERIKAQAQAAAAGLEDAGEEEGAESEEGEQRAAALVGAHVQVEGGCGHAAGEVAGEKEEQEEGARPAKTKGRWQTKLDAPPAPAAAKRKPRASAATKGEGGAPRLGLKAAPAAAGERGEVEGSAEGGGSQEEGKQAWWEEEAGGPQVRRRVRGAAPSKPAEQPPAAAESPQGRGASLVAGRAAPAAECGGKQGASAQHAGRQKGSERKREKKERNVAGPVDDEGRYYVEKIMGARWRRGRREFLIKWWGYDESWNTWEPPSSLDQKPEQHKVAKGVDLDVGPTKKLSLPAA